MPQVPYQEYPSSVPNSLGDKAPYQSTAGSGPEAFGSAVAQAGTGLAGAISGAADKTAGFAFKLRDQADEAENNEATTKAIVGMGEVDNWFRGLTGKDAANARPEFIRRLTESRTEIRSGLSSPYVQRMFDQSTMRQMGYNVVNGSKYAADQDKIARVAASDAALSLAGKEAALKHDDDQFATAVSPAEIERVVRTNPKFAGLGDDVIKDKVQEEISTRWTQRIEATSYTDAPRALKMLQKAGDSVNPLTAERLKSSVYQSVISQRSRDLAVTAVGDGPVATQADREAYLMRALMPIVGRNGAAGLIGGFFQESGLRSDANNPRDASDGTASYGFGQWNKERLTALKKVAEERGTDPSDFKTQVAHLVNELKDKESSAAAGIRAAGSVDDAAVAARKLFERPKESAAHDENRIAHARRIAGLNIQPGFIEGSGPGDRARIVEEVKRKAAEEAKGFGMEPAITEQFVSAAAQAVEGQYGKKTAEYRDGVYGQKMKVADIALNPDNPPKTEAEFLAKAGQEGAIAWNALPAPEKEHWRKLFQRNADNQETETSDEKFHTLLGQARDPATRREFLDNISQHLTDPELSKSARNELRRTAGSLQKEREAPAPVARAMSQLTNEGMFVKSAVNKNNQALLHQFTGSLEMALAAEAKESGGKVSPERISQIGAQVMAQVTLPGAVWGTNYDYGKSAKEIADKAPTQSAKALDKTVPVSAAKQIYDMAIAEKLTLVPGQLHRLYYDPRIRKKLVDAPVEPIKPFDPSTAKEPAPEYSGPMG